MRAVLLIVPVMAACTFSPRGIGPDDGDAAIADAPAGDGPAIDAATDAAIDAPIDAAIDARVCPAAPSGCQPFTCAGVTGCHYLCSARLSWTGAQARCATVAGGCLATIDSGSENGCLALNGLPTFPDLLWFGWRQVGGNEPAGGWGWECGGSTFVAGNWGFGEPNDQNGEDCGAMGTGGAWIDGDCGTMLRFVCEVP